MTQTGNDNIVFSIKSQLAKLLATEDITVQHKAGMPTACFDIKNRVLTLPVWQNISENLYDMLVVHEVGHALDTPTQDWADAIENIVKKHHDLPTNAAKQAVKDYLNVIEDARIDKRQKRRYPGSKRNYVIGYKELNDRNFFGIQGKEIASLPFIDRINLYFKTVGVHIQFNSEERPFLNKIENAETFEDVIKLTDEIYGYSVQKKEEQRSQTQQNQQDDSDENDEEQDDDNNSYGDNDDDSSDDNEKDDIDDDSDFQDSTDSDDADEEVESDDDTTDYGQDGAEPDEDEEIHQSDIPESITEKAARQNMQTIVRDDDTNYIYCDFPKFDLSRIVDDYPKVVEEMSNSIQQSYSNHWNPTYYREAIDSLQKEFTYWKTKENETISFMIKEFEMKKAADLHSRVSIAKTGVIDTNKLHSYKYNEDIFRKLSVLPQGKSHGFVMILDWSGSMMDCMDKTIKQLLSLTMFCKRVQIPFEVYLFRNAVGNEIDARQFIQGQHGIKFSPFKLRNILSSRMNLATLNKAYLNLWGWRYLNYSDRMDSTPLNQSILALDEIVNNFQRKNKLQIVSTVILTDGSSDGSYIDYDVKNIPNKPKGNRFIFRDEKTKTTYTTGRSGYFGSDATPICLKILQDRTGCNLIGFYLHNGHVKHLSHLAEYSWLTDPVTVKKWKEDKFLALSNVGYDEYYVLNCTNKRGDLENDTLNVDSNMTKSKIAKEFIRFSEKKTINRVLLSKFISRVSATHKKAA